MRRGDRLVGRVTLVVAVLLLVPLAVSAAAVRPAWTGVYQGGATGRALGESKGAHATVFVTQKGDQVNFLVQVAGYSVEGMGTPQGGDADMIVVPIKLEGADVTGTGEAVLERVKGRWTLSMTGEGTAYGISGEGALSAKLAKTRMPAVTEQIAGTVKASLGSTDTAHVPPPADGPVGPLTPPEPSSPPPTQDSLIAYWLSILILIMEIMIG